MNATSSFRDGTGWQDVGSYSRAVRRGSRILVSGTTANSPTGTVMFPGDTYAQTRRCLDLVVAAVEKLGASADDVLSTRVMLAPGASWQEATRAHGERFAHVYPVNTMFYVEALIGEGFLVEVEAEAVLDP